VFNVFNVNISNEKKDRRTESRHEERILVRENSRLKVKFQSSFYVSNIKRSSYRNRFILVEEFMNEVKSSIHRNKLSTSKETNTSFWFTALVLICSTNSLELYTL